MKVYIVNQGFEYEGTAIWRVCATRAIAERWMQEAIAADIYADFWEIEEYGVEDQ